MKASSACSRTPCFQQPTAVISCFTIGSFSVSQLLRTFLLLLIFLSGQFVPNQLIAQNTNKDESAIRNILLRQQADWNKGNTSNFMKGYWENDSLLFIGSSVTKGYRSTLERYNKNYPDTASMGKLQFEFLEFRKLSDEYYFVVGKWHLTRTKGDAGGMYTLLFRKIKGEWAIVVDHSS